MHAPRQRRRLPSHLKLLSITVDPDEVSDDSRYSICQPPPRCQPVCFSHLRLHPSPDHSEGQLDRGAVSAEALSQLPEEARADLVARLGQSGAKYADACDPDVLARATIDAVAGGDWRHDPWRTGELLAKLPRSVVPHLEQAIEGCAAEERRVLERDLVDIEGPTVYHLRAVVTQARIEATLSWPGGEQDLRLPVEPTRVQLASVLDHIDNPRSAVLQIEAHVTDEAHRSLGYQWSLAIEGLHSVTDRTIVDE